MNDTNHQNELKEVKAKAFKILGEEGVLSALETVVNTGLVDVGLLGTFDSPIKEVTPNIEIEAEREDKWWRHHAYLLGGVQTIQISHHTSSSLQEMRDRQAIYVFNNKELVLHDRGGCVSEYLTHGNTPWEFEEYGASWIESVKLNKVWMGAVKEIASELKRVKTLEASQSREERNRADEMKAEKDKSKFDLGDFD